MTMHLVPFITVWHGPRLGLIIEDILRCHTEQKQPGADRGHNPDDQSPKE
jgi:hypothetical protein